MTAGEVAGAGDVRTALQPCHAAARVGARLHRVAVDPAAEQHRLAGVERDREFDLVAAQAGVLQRHGAPVDRGGALDLLELLLQLRP